MSGAYTLKSCQGKDGLIHVRLSPTRRSFCRSTLMDYDCRYLHLRVWLLSEAKDGTHFCQECRVRVIEELKGVGTN